MRKFWNWIRDDSGGRVLRLEGPIDADSLWSDGVTPKAFRDDLYAEEGDVTIYIHSPGGNVFAAAEIYTMMRDYPGTVTVKIDAIAASAASVVAVAGDRVMMSPVAMLMIHDPVTIAMGNSKAMEKAISTLNEVKESIINAYSAKTGLSRGKVARLMSDETWMNARKAVELGFADEIMFDDRKTDSGAGAEEQEDGQQDGEDTPKEGEHGEIHLNASKAVEALEGLLYSTRTMGQAILGSIGAFDEGEAADTGTAKDDSAAGDDAPDGSDAGSDDAGDDGAQVQSEGSEHEANHEDEPEGGATNVAEDTAAEEASVTDTTVTDASMSDTAGKAESRDKSKDESESDEEAESEDKPES